MKVPYAVLTHGKCVHFFKKVFKFSEFNFFKNW